jgi:hypothetical protein
MSYVYFIACYPLHAVKIGFTRGSPRDRMSALQTGSAAPLKLVACFPGSVTDERALHEAFRALHIHREWFRYEGKLKDFACALGMTSERGGFEDCVHMVLKNGIWHHSDGGTEEGYHATGSWKPFARLIASTVDPWDAL